MPRLLEGQPRIYATFFPDFFATEVPAETKATCTNCAMCEKPLARDASAFRPDTKCCTYHPKLPNYLLGALLADSDPSFDEGRRRVRDRIARRFGSTPQWLKAPSKYDVLYKSTRAGFGRAKSLLCPYFVDEGGLCSIWPYREAVCSTFFCKHVGGADGRSFWMSFKRYLSLAEIQLSRYALLQHFPEWVLRQGDTPKTPTDPLTVRELDDEPTGDEVEHLLAWGEWDGREEELYRKCYETVQNLSAAEFAAIMGLDGTVHVAVLGELRAAVTAPRLPSRPKLNPSLTVNRLSDGAVALSFHSDYDALALPEAGWRLLEEFRGEESLAAVRARLREKHGSDFSDEIFAELHRHRILI